MPYKDPEKQRLAMLRIKKEWVKKHPNAEKLRKRLQHEKTRDTRLKRMRERNRAAGHTERPKGTKARVEMVLPATRKWSIFTDKDGIPRLYFTSKKGFELSEMQEILREFKEARKRVLESQL